MDNPPSKNLHPLNRGRLVWFALLFLALAALCSWPRFGQRENEHLAELSDSDFFLDMARVFTGDAPAFNPEYLKLGPHHYNRPLISFLAGHLGKHVLGGNVRAGFSIVNIVAAAGMAWLLMLVVLRTRPEWKLFWLPSVLFVSGFPQINWGYHILSDNLGLATGFAVSCYAAWLIGRIGTQPALSPGAWALHLAALWMSSSIAFLARETGLFAVVVIGVLGFLHRRRPPRELAIYGLLFVVVVLGKTPSWLYAQHYHVAMSGWKSTWQDLTYPRYILDAVVKTGVCFNLAWLLAAWAWLKRGRERTPDFLLAWFVAAVLYSAAGYAKNWIDQPGVNDDHPGGIGFPIRMAYSMFPAVFFYVTLLLERRMAAGGRSGWVALYLAVQTGVNALGVMMDSGGHMNIGSVMQTLKKLISP